MILYSTENLNFKIQYSIIYIFQLYSALLCKERMIEVGVCEQVYRTTNKYSDTMKISDSIRSTGQTLLDQLDKLQCHNYVIMSQSTEHYVRRLPIQTKRKLYIYFYLILNIILDIKYGVLSFNDQDWILALLGEHFHEFESIKLKSRIIFLTTIGISVFIIVVHYLESRHQLVHLDYIFKNISGRKDFVLPSKYQTIFVKRNLTLCTKMNKLNNFLKIPIIFIIFIFPILSYSYTKVKQNLAIYFIYNFGSMVWAIYAYNAVLTMLIWSCIIITYIQLKFTAIIEIIMSNTLLVKRAIINYDKAYKILRDLTKSADILLSLIYLFFPILYALILDIMIDMKARKTNEEYNFFLPLSINFIINYIIYDKMSSISTTNTSILKNLYPILVDKNFRKLKLRLRIDSFIARLNTEYIGFHCWFSIKFKRLSFYEYLIGLSGTYFLISTTINTQIS